MIVPAFSNDMIIGMCEQLNINPASVCSITIKLTAGEAAIAVITMYPTEKNLGPLTEYKVRFVDEVKLA